MPLAFVMLALNFIECSGKRDGEGVYEATPTVHRWPRTA